VILRYKVDIGHTAGGSVAWDELDVPAHVSPIDVPPAWSDAANNFVYPEQVRLILAGSGPAFNMDTSRIRWRGRHYALYAPTTVHRQGDTDHHVSVILMEVATP